MATKQKVGKEFSPMSQGGMIIAFQDKEAGVWRGEDTDGNSCAFSLTGDKAVIMYNSHEYTFDNPDEMSLIINGQDDGLGDEETRQNLGPFILAIRDEMRAVNNDRGIEAVIAGVQNGSLGKASVIIEGAIDGRDTRIGVFTKRKEGGGGVRTMAYVAFADMNSQDEGDGLED